MEDDLALSLPFFARKADPVACHNVPSYGTFKLVRMLHVKVISLCRERGLTVSDALDQAGVSRNAYYSLVRKPSVLPASIEALADVLGVPPSEFLEDRPSVVAKANEMAMEVDRIVRKHRGVDRDNIRHTLLLLDEEPIERLRRALRRGQRIHFQS